MKHAAVIEPIVEPLARSHELHARGFRWAYRLDEHCGGFARTKAQALAAVKKRAAVVGADRYGLEFGEFSLRSPATADSPARTWTHRRLTEAQARAIKAGLRDGVFRQDLARRFGCSYQMICAIAEGRAWGHVEPEKSKRQKVKKSKSEAVA